MYHILLFLLLITLTTSQVITCGSGNTPYQTNGEPRYYVCTNVTGGATFKPSLPEGLTLVEGVIKGTPKRSFDTIRIHIKSDGRWGDWFVSSHKKLTNVGIGFKSQILYMGVPFTPIRFFPNSHFESFRISPKITDGLIFDESLGTISGMYVGEEKTVEYTVTAVYNSHYNISDTFSFIFKNPSSSLQNGYSMCYYPLEEWENFFSELYFQQTPVDSCVLVNQPLNFTEKYHIEFKHYWPGIPDFYEKTFLMKLTGIFMISTDGEYEFYIRGTNAIRLMLDSTVVLEMGYAGSSYAEASVNHTLSSGYHLLTIYYTHRDLDAHLFIKYRNSQTQDWIPFSGDTLFYTGRSPAFLVYPSISTSYSSYVNHTFSSLSLGAVYKYHITPALPNGLVLNAETGSITGLLSTTMYQQYTITAEGYLGETSTSFSILVDETPLPGIEGSYYAIDEDIDVCKTTMFYEYEKELITKRIDETLTFPYQPRKGFWPGIPAAVFTKYAYIEWNGLLKIDKEGDWMFYFTYIDGVRVKIDNELIVNSYSCGETVTEMERSISFTHTGYYTLSIQYFTNDDDFVFAMKVMKPGMTEYIDLSKDLLAHYPYHPFTITTTQTRWIQNQSIQSIQPRFYGISFTPSFSITPSLPEGISMSSEGVISGTPTTLLEETEYTITAKSKDIEYSTLLTVSSYTAVLPTAIHIQNKEGKEIEELSLEIYKEMEDLTISCEDESFCSISIQPAFPSGLSFDSKTGLLTGRPLESVVKTVFTITATSEAGSITKILSLTIPSCQYGYYFYLHASGDEYDLVITDKDHTVYQETKKKADKYSSILCLPKQDYVFSIFNSTASSSLYSFSLTREDGIVYYDERLKNPSFSAPFEVALHSKPYFTFQLTTFYLIPNEKFKIPFEITGLYRPLTIQPTFPDTIKLNVNFLTITGSIRREGFYEYTLHCENEVGITEVTLHFYVNQCPPSTYPFYGKRSFAAIGDSFTIEKEATHELIINHDLGFDTSDDLLLCLENIPYIITFYTKQDASPPYPRTLSLYDSNHILLSSYSLFDQGKQQMRLRWVDVFKEGQEKKIWMSKKEVNKKWKVEGFNDKKWTLMNSQTKAYFSSDYKTVYFRYFVNWDEKDMVSSFNTHIKAKGGVILYVNGVEAVRLNLPYGPISRTQMGHEDIDLSNWFHISLNANLFHPGSNCIAVELHCYAVQDPSVYQILFDMKSYQLTSSSLYLSQEGLGTPSASQNVIDPNSNVNTAFFDTNDYTYWGDKGFPMWIRFTFPNQQYEYVNKMVLRSTAVGMYDPTQFVIYGVRNETVYENGRYSMKETKEVLRYMNNYYLFEGKPSYEVSFWLNTQTPYQAYEMEIYRGMNYTMNSVRVNQIRLYAERQVWCEEEKKWPRTLSTTYAYGKCPFLKIGKTSRYCNMNESRGIWEAIDESTCLTRWTGKNEAYIDLEYKLVNCTMGLWKSMVEEAFREVIVREVTVKEEEVFFYLPYECHEEAEVPAVCVNVRLKPHRLTSEYVKMELITFNKNATNLFYRKQTHSIPVRIEIQSSEKITIHQRWSGKDILFTSIICILTLLYILLLILVCKNMKIGRSSTRKTLPKKSNVAASSLTNNSSRDTPLLKL